MLKFGFQEHSSGSENDRKDSASQPSNQSDTGKQGLGPLGNAIAVHAAVKVGTDQPPSTYLSALWEQRSRSEVWRHEESHTDPCVGSVRREHCKSGGEKGAFRVCGPRVCYLCRHRVDLPHRRETHVLSFLWNPASRCLTYKTS